MENALKITIGLCLVLASSLISGCGGITEKSDVCGSQHLHSLSGPLSYVSPNFYVESGPANSGTSCEATFSLEFQWYGSRALTDTSMPPLHDLKNSFHVNSDYLVFSADTPNPTRTKDPQSGTYQWKIQFNDHNTGDTAASNYYIKTYLNSINTADSVSVSGIVYYYDPL